MVQKKRTAKQTNKQKKHPVSGSFTALFLPLRSHFPTCFNVIEALHLCMTLMQ